ncbi:MAG: 3-oxoacyl-ACP reductase FabG [Clostridia bacterium]
MKIVIITGASRGIGQIITSVLAKNDFCVIANYNHSEKEAFALCDDLAKQGLSCIPYKADISDQTQVNAMVDFVVKRFGKIDLLVNNAGISRSGLLIDMPLSDITDLLDTNLLGAILVTQAVARQMLAQHAGNIINISSMWGQVGASCESVYSASKGGLIAFTKALAKELGYNGINVNCICPGVIDTTMNANISQDDLAALVSETPCSRLGAPQDIANCVLWLASDNASFVNGQIIGVNGGFVI